MVLSFPVLRPDMAEDVRIDYENGYYVGTVLEDGVTENGLGMFIWNTGESYVGYFLNGVRTGRGTFRWPDGKVYEGDFLDDTRSGHGKLKWPAGDVYEGDFVNGIFHGKGRLTWANGESYEGDFVNGKMEGMGVHYAADGSPMYVHPREGETRRPHSGRPCLPSCR